MPKQSDWTAKDILTAVGLTDAEQEAVIRKHEMIKGTLESTNERELAAKFAFTIRNVPGKDLRDMFLTNSKKKDSDPTLIQMSVLENDNIDNLFADFALEPNGAAMTQAYLTAKPTAMNDLNLSRDELQLFEVLPKTATQQQVTEVLVRVLKQRLMDYQQKGLEGIGLYCRGKNAKNDYAPGEELRLKSEQANLVKKVSPAFYKYLVECPSNKPDKLEESYMYMTFIVDEKPTTALVHKMGLWDEESGLYVLCQRHFYVSRGHNSLQGVGGAIPIKDGGGEDETAFVVVYGSRTSTDQVAGFGGSAKRALGSRIMGGRLAENMERLRQEMQKK